MTIIYVIALVILWIAPIVWAWRTKHEKRILILILCLLFGLFGYIVSLIIVLHKSTPQPQSGDEGVYLCPNCETPYRLSDYRPDAKIICAGCRQEIVRAVG
jgi:hypothetical protein